MYRVLLKIDKVSIRIKQTVDIHTVIKKAHEFFSHCKHQKLVNGVLTLNNSSEFFISVKDPSFQIEIYLVSGSIRKKGGSVQLNLSNYTINTSHRITSIIRNTPLQNSTLLIDFTYLMAEEFFSNKHLVSLSQLEEIKHKHYLKSITHQNQELIMQNQRLNREITGLKVKNESLSTSSKQMENEHEKRQTAFKEELEKMEEEKSYNYQTLLNEKKKIAEIMDIINQTGDPHLINEMGDIISKNETRENSQQ